MNVFVKPNEQSRSCASYAEAGKRLLKTNAKNSTVMKRPYDAMKPLGRLLGVFALLLSTGTICLCCSSDPATPDAPAEEGGGNLDPDEPDKLPDVAAYKVPDVVEMGFADTFLLPCSGAGTDDYLLLTARNDASETHRMPVTEVDQTQGASLQTPAGFIGGMYDFTFYKNGKALDLGTAFVDVVDRTEVPQVPGSTVYGRVIDHTGKPIAGVSVSDGVFVTATDDEGRYYLSSLKQRGYVFITVPAGYRAAVNRTIPQFFRRLSGSPQTYEQRSFVLAPEANERHRMIVFTDTHLANRTNDIHQFENGFKADLRKQIAQAKAEGVSLYAMALGDLTWDEYWYKNSYQPSHYVRQMADLDIPIYNIPGNHDNDPYVADDFESENPWRENLGPTYYSFDIGDIHYIQLDNTLFTNTGGAQGTVGKLDYTEGLTADQLRWLEADLQRIPAGKTVFVGMHIQFTNRYRIADGKLSWSYAMPADCRAKMLDLLAPYTVHFVTGHTHINYANRITERMTEHNIAAVCATWWWTGNYTNGRTQMCRDGAPAGYGLFENGTAGADDVQWHYQGIGKAADYQFRAYDLNRCLITRDKYCPDIKNDFGTVSAEFFSQYANGYDRPRSDNAVLINVFNWNEKWKVEVREVETGNRLPVEQVDTYDPLHTIHFNMNRMNTNSTAMTFPTLLTSHMFEAVCSSPTTALEITVTDEFGRSYTETMSRPRELYDMSVSPQW